MSRIEIVELTVLCLISNGNKVLLQISKEHEALVT